MDASISVGAKALIKHAFSDIDPVKIHDIHMHVVGLDSVEGTYVNPRILAWWHLMDFTKSSVYLSGAGVKSADKILANKEYMDRILRLVNAVPGHGNYHLLAFDKHYNPDGTVNDAKTEFYTSNAYVMQQASLYPKLFIPVISVHPYRKDALQEVEKWAKQGVRWIKWLPNAQGINPADPRIDPYYQLMKQYHMILLTHVGEEQAVKAEEDQRLGNPLLFRHALDMGVRVVMAHCASLGENEDLDHPGHKASNFDLFLRLMEEKRYNGYLYGEISATTQFNRLPTPMLTLLKRTDLHARLLNGSDYPLPALNIVIQTRALEKNGFISTEERQYLNEIYHYNPLLFDYVVKRTLRHPETHTGFSPVVFLDIDAEERK